MVRNTPWVIKEGGWAGGGSVAPPSLLLAAPSINGEIFQCSASGLEIRAWWVNVSPTCIGALHFMKAFQKGKRIECCCFLFFYTFHSSPLLVSALWMCHKKLKAFFRCFITDGKLPLLLLFASTLFVFESVLQQSSLCGVTADTDKPLASLPS